jgi:hypothetical protein
MKAQIKTAAWEYISINTKKYITPYRFSGVIFRQHQKHTIAQKLIRVIMLAKKLASFQIR